jgi:hypothetical protein
MANMLISLMSLFWRVEIPICIGLLAGAHYTFEHYWPNYKPSARYFLFHFIVNMFVVNSTIGITWDTLQHPTVIYPTDPLPALILLIFHVYHCLCYQLTVDDVLHHIVNVFLIGPITALGSCNLCAVGCCFLSGLPGGLIYLLLTLQYWKLISAKTQKWWAVQINMWLRSPGCIITGYLALLHAARGEFITTYPPAAEITIATASAIAVMINGQYFLSTILASHGRHE